ncbi:MAG: glycosyltransferase family 4 protein [Nanobdellota archaeon]
MKIVRTIESFYPFITGPANQAFSLSRSLKKNYIESPILTTNYNAEDAIDFEEIEGVQIRRFRIKYSILRFFYTPGFKKQIMEENPGIIHAHNYRSYQTECAYRAAKEMGKPLVINSHGSITGYKKTVKGMWKVPYILYDTFTGYKCLDYASRIIVNSRQEYNEAVEYGIDEKKLTIMPFGIDTNKYLTKKKGKNKLTLLFVGNISRNRNLEPIIEAMKDIDKSISLRIVGGEMKSSSTYKSGYIDELKNLAKENGVFERIVFTGQKRGKELIDEYKNADIFVYTSLSENFGQTILEASAAGLPLVLTPVGIAEDIVKEGKTGHIVDFHDPGSIANRVNGLLDFKHRQEMGKILHNKIAKDYSWEKIMMDYEKLYYTIAKEYNLVK